MAILVLPGSEQEEKVLLAFLDSLQYEYKAAEIDIKPSHDEERQTIEEYNNEIAEAESEYKKGKSVSSEDLKKNMQGW